MAEVPLDRLSDSTRAEEVDSLRVVVTGGAGFIGSNLSDALVARGHEVVVVDNFSTGREANLAKAGSSGRLWIEKADLVYDAGQLARIMEGADAVYHLAANADVRFGWEAPRRDLEQNLVATLNVLEAMRQNGVSRILFSSTGSIYGETTVVPTPEDCPFPSQTSLYGASKLAAEGYLSAYAEGSGFSVTVFRFVSIMGPRYSHGHVLDFVNSLRRDPSQLQILGDGGQRKSYLEVSDCVAALVAGLDRFPAHEVFNLGCDGYCTVVDSAGWICERMGVSPTFTFTGGDRGWVGDNPFIYLATDRIRATGWSPKFTIREAVERTVDYLLDQPAAS